MSNYYIVDCLSKKHTEQLVKLLHKQWWCSTRTLEEVLIMLKTCLSFGLIEESSGDLVGYARVLTDGIKYAYVYDVIVEEKLHGHGLGKFIINEILESPKLKDLKKLELTCAPNMISFYKKFGFSTDYGKEVVPMRLSKL
jgi:ribosomal protein S18 acetylase RimI-like enzyme